MGNLIIKNMNTYHFILQLEYSDVLILSRLIVRTVLSQISSVNAEGIFIII